MISFLMSLFERRPPRPVYYISWYKDARPWMDHVQYLALCHDDSGFYYTRDKAVSHRFGSFDEAKRVTPVYDGSAGIEERTGVEAVNG